MKIEVRAEAPRTETHDAARHWSSRLPFYYGWLIIGIAFVTMAIGVTARMAFSLLMPRSSSSSDGSEVWRQVLSWLKPAPFRNLFLGEREQQFN